MTRKEHWESVYQEKVHDEVSWFAPHLRDSLSRIVQVSSPSARVIDVGAGASTLVDDLLKLGYRHLTVLDVSSRALEVSRQRLGDRGLAVTWLVADVTKVELEPNSFDLWHDRAVFHFLTEQVDRRAYVEQVRRSVVGGGHVVVGTFSMTGPTRCSGLEVVRYDATSLSREFGEDFTLTAESTVTHVTPSGRPQDFLFCCFQKRG